MSYSGSVFSMGKLLFLLRYNYNNRRQPLFIAPSFSPCFSYNTNQEFFPYNSKDSPTCLIERPQLKIRLKLSVLVILPNLLWSLLPRSFAGLILPNCRDIAYQPRVIIFQIQNMSLLRKSSRAVLRATPEDYTAAMDHKNAIIATLTSEREAMSAALDRHDRAKEDLSRARARYEGLLREQQMRAGNNQERLEMTVRGVQELRMQAEQLGEELKLKMAALREAKFSAQQLADLAGRREEEAGEVRFRLHEQQSLEEMRGIEQERTRLQIAQVREEAEKGKREAAMLRTHGEELSQRTHKTQSYLRNLMREETNLNESLSRLEDQNAGLDASISELDTAISINKGEISNKEKDCQELQFHIASKELERRKTENEIREKVKQLTAEKEKWRGLCSQWEHAKSESARFESLLGDTSDEINYILAKNNEIAEVNEQLKDDLAVCQRHLDNLSRVNRSLEEEIGCFHQANLKTINKLREPFANRTTSQTQQQPLPAAYPEKWGAASRATDFETGDFEAWK